MIIVLQLYITQISMVALIAQTFNTLTDFVTNRCILVVCNRIMEGLTMVAFGVGCFVILTVRLKRSDGALTQDDISFYTLYFAICCSTLFISLPIIILQKLCFHCSGVDGHVWTISPDSVDEKRGKFNLHYSFWNAPV